MLKSNNGNNLRLPFEDLLALFGPSKEPEPLPTIEEVDPLDVAILKDQLSKDEKTADVFNGNLDRFRERYGNDFSTADMGFIGVATKYTSNPLVIRDLMRGCDLYREKLDREDYLLKSILKALESKSQKEPAPISAGNPNQGVYRFSWDDNPLEVQPLLEFKGTGILYPEGITLLTGPQGKGKSQITHALASAALNPDCDSLGFSTESFPILLIDTENPLSIFRKNVRRGLSRAGIAEGTDISGNVDYVNIRGIETFEDRQTYLFETMEKGIYKLYIIDGAGDFVLDVNNVEASIPFVSKLCAMTLKHNCGAFITLHANPTAFNEKARGHLGSELLRKADCTLLLKVEGESRCITTSYSQGKNRAGNDDLTQYFTWNDTLKMHVSCEAPLTKKATGKIEKECDLILEQMGFEKFSFTGLKEIVRKVIDDPEKPVSDKTVKNRITKLKEDAKITHDENKGLYFVPIPDLSQ